MPSTRAPATSKPRTTAATATGRAARSGNGRTSRSAVGARSGWPSDAAAPVLVEQRRGGIVESRHRGHVVQVDSAGAVERAIGDPDVIVTLRSAVKPFALVALVESGAADELSLTDPELAVMASSHHGEDLHVRTLQAVFRRAALSQSLLACGSAGAPLDELTRARLARDGEAPGPIRHMCSGFHAASILLSRHEGWSLEDYSRPEHPSQIAVRSAVARCFGVTPDDLVMADDDCGVQTYAFPLVAVARAYALLADPHGAALDARRLALAPALVRVRDAMLAAPELVGGARDSLTTSVMKVASGRVVSKSGAESLEGVGFVPRDGAPGGGLAAKIEDGDGRGRALAPAVIAALGQVGVLGEPAARSLAPMARPTVDDARGEVVAEAVATFELAPISELA